VLGNHDAEELAEQPRLPIEFLNDRNVTLDVRGASIVLVGVNQALGGTGDVEAALRGAPEGYAAVLLAHYPSTVRRVRDGRVRLVLAGHTHGGQIRLPLLGCVWAHDGIPVRMARGLHELNGVPMHVSAGVGVSSFLRFRVLCPPEVSVLTLRSVGEEVTRETRGDRRREADVAACGV
jgi:predicted MPP superfamily phosphohydrolase